MSKLIGQKVRIYRNLHDDCWSVLLKGKVVAHAVTVLLRDANFAVQPGGYARFLKEQRKNVHAFVVGELDSLDKPMPEEAMVEVVYNPRIASTFHTVQKCFKGREYHFDNIQKVRQAYCCAQKTVWVTI